MGAKFACKKCEKLLAIRSRGLCWSCAAKFGADGGPSPVRCINCRGEFVPTYQSQVSCRNCVGKRPNTRADLRDTEGVMMALELFYTEWVASGRRLFQGDEFWTARWMALVAAEGSMAAAANAAAAKRGKEFSFTDDCADEAA